MSSTNALKFPTEQEAGSQLKVVPNHKAQVTGQINDSRPAVEQALKVYPLDDDPNFTAEELMADCTASGAKTAKAGLKDFTPDHLCDPDQPDDYPVIIRGMD